jgi:uncharacterized membrane protein YfcA
MSWLRPAPLLIRLVCAVRSATERIATGYFTRAAIIVLAVWALCEFSEIERAIALGDEQALLLLAVVGVVALSALLSSIAGFAFCALAGSAFAYLGVDPVRSVQAMVLCSIAIQLYAVWKIRGSVRWPSFRWMLAGGAVTVPLGVWMLTHIDSGVYAAGLGVFLTAYGCYAVLRRETRIVPGKPWQDAIAGALGGVAGGLAGLTGSFVTIWCSMRGWDKLRQRAAYQPYILAMQLEVLACLRFQVSSSMHAAEGLRLIPFAMLGAVGGFALFERMTSKQVHAAISILLMMSGIGLLNRSL